MQYPVMRSEPREVTTYRYPAQPKEAEDFFKGMVKTGLALICAGLLGVLILAALGELKGR
ncbi:MAG: hypothetical protein QMC90_04785 [Dehalococcoidales bacterium]|nr:hypothetical protein [Dehalococcoidales bacterium]